MEANKHEERHDASRRTVDSYVIMGEQMDNKN